MLNKFLCDEESICDVRGQLLWLVEVGQNQNEG
jgi:hypothetical protein